MEKKIKKNAKKNRAKGTSAEGVAAKRGDAEKPAKKTPVTAVARVAKDPKALKQERRARKKAEKAARKLEKKAAKKDAKASKGRGGKKIKKGKDATGLAPGMPWISPYLTVKDVEGALAWYARALGFKERFRMAGPGGKVVHAEMEHQSGVIMLGPEDPERGSKAPASFGGSPVGMHAYVADVDATFATARAAGATVAMEPTDMFWGDRAARVVDPEGHSWMLATFKRRVSPEEIDKAMAGQPA